MAEANNSHDSCTVQLGDTVYPNAHEALKEFWPKIMDEVKNTPIDIKTQELPLARIKKIMKLDDEVKMISAEAPVVFAKAAEIFITELTLRAWMHTEDNRRRTLQKNDIAMAIAKHDQFDFLIDIVPREELSKSKSRTTTDEASKSNLGTPCSVPGEVQYFLNLSQHQQMTAATPTANATAAGGIALDPSQLQTVQIMQPNGQIQQVAIVPSGVANQATLLQQQVSPNRQHTVTVLDGSKGLPNAQGTTEIVVPSSSCTTVLGDQQQVFQTTQAALGGGTGGLQILQQIMGPDGQIQAILVPASAGQQGATISLGGQQLSVGGAQMPTIMSVAGGTIQTHLQLATPNSNSVDESGGGHAVVVTSQ